MAHANYNLFLKNLKGTIGKQMVIKKYGDKTVISAYPDMENIKPSPVQEIFRERFKNAVAYARGINNNNEKRKLYSKKVKKHQSVYHYAVAEYLANEKKVNGPHRVRKSPSLWFGFLLLFS